jgi:Uma2 family endonuclease
MTVALAERIEIRLEMADREVPRELTLDEMFGWLERMPVPEGYRVEIVEGTIYMSPQRAVHWDIIFDVAEQLRETYPRKRLLSDVRIDFPGFLNGFCPDLVALREGARKDDKGLIHPEDIEFLLEVVSKGTGPNDYGPKKATYAETGVPAYLIADPFVRRCRLFTEPKEGEYLSELTVAFGQSINLKDTAVGLALSTEEFPQD